MAWLAIESADLSDELVEFIVFNGERVCCGMYFESRWVDAFSDMIDPQPTHYQPLPTPPFITIELQKREAAMTEDREIAGSCETCSTPIYAGDMHGPCGDGIMLCEEHTFMLSDALEQQRDAVKANDPGDFEFTIEEMREHVAAMEAEIATTGDRKVLCVA